jgi:hypothetical protein
MRQRMKITGICQQKRQPQDYQSIVLSILTPHLWKVLIALALPFIVLCANCCEALERTSVVGAYIADILLPVVIIGYMVLIITLRNREI